MHIKKLWTAEFLGTFTMVFAGTAAMAVNETQAGVVSHVGIGLTWGLVVMSMIYAFGSISGAHFNPAVTIAFAAAKKFSWKSVPAYLSAQSLGAIGASAMLKYLVPQSELLGATIPSIPHEKAFILELLLSFFLMMVIIFVSTGSKEVGIVAGIAIGGVVLLEALFAGPLTNASMNPARSLGPALISGKTDPLWIYLTAPVVGALLAILCCKLIKPAPCCDQDC